MSPEILPIFLFIIGLCFGSFVTLASYRLPREEDIVRKPSRCPSCDTVLRIPDLFPVLSWLRQGGKCRHCRVPIHWRYPVIELITGLLFVLAYQRYGLTLSAFCLMAVAVVLMVMIVADFEHYIIPDQVHLALLPLGLAHAAVTGRDWGDVAGGFLLGMGIGLALYHGYSRLRKREVLGYGDVKFLAVAGLWLGTLNIVPFLFLSGLVGTVTGLFWRLLGRGVYYPFGPALAAAFYLCVMYPELPAAFWHAAMWVRGGSGW